MVTLHPVAKAPASIHFVTLPVKFFNDFKVSLLVVNMALVDAGIIFAALGASRMAQWILSVSWICCRSIERLLYDATSASSAFTPSQGFPPAWAFFP